MSSDDDHLDTTGQQIVDEAQEQVDSMQEEEEDEEEEGFEGGNYGMEGMGESALGEASKIYQFLKFFFILCSLELSSLGTHPIYSRDIPTFYRRID